jgi:hypothetical protein
MGLVARHQREIAPLLKRRSLFAESGNFLLYDFFVPSGLVDENVFAYSNRNGGDRALVVYNNKYGTTHGTIRISAAYADKGAGQLRQQSLGEGLGFGGGSILAYRDSLTGLEYLRRAGELGEGGLTLDLHAYQCHVFLDWREVRATAEHPWDRLCDRLKGRGVPSLDDALVNLELQPVHDALRRQLDPALVRSFADVAEHPRTLPAATRKETERERVEFFASAWDCCESFLRAAQTAYVARVNQDKTGAEAVVATNPALLAQAFRERLRAAIRIPAIEALFPVPWTAAARRMLPSPSPQHTATAMWGPVLAWCALELLAESIDIEHPERVALDLFDRLRLREPFAQAFAALGFEGEEGWRVAARIKVVLLTGAGVGMAEEAPVEPAAEAAARENERPEIDRPAGEAVLSAEEKVALAPVLWLDPDVRWLTGVHKAEGHEYLVREHYEELLWWLLMPSLLKLAGEAKPRRSAVFALSKTVDEALTTAEAAGYRIDYLLGVDAVEEEVETAATEPDTEAATIEQETPVAAEVVTEESPGAATADSKIEPAEPE